MAKAKTRKTKASNVEVPADQAAAATPLEIEQGRRRLHDFLKFWRVCRGKACKRARRCSGELSACGARHFPLVPEDFKALLQKAIEGVRAGLSPQEAVRAAKRHIAAVDAALARLDQREAEAQAAQAARVEQLRQQHAATAAKTTARVRVL